MTQPHLQRKADERYLRYEMRNVQPSWRPPSYRRHLLAAVITIFIAVAVATLWP